MWTFQTLTCYVRKAEPGVPDEYIYTIINASMLDYQYFKGKPTEPVKQI